MLTLSSNEMRALVNSMKIKAYALCTELCAPVNKPSGASAGASDLKY